MNVKHQLQVASEIGFNIGYNIKTYRYLQKKFTVSNFI